MITFPCVIVKFIIVLKTEVSIACNQFWMLSIIVSVSPGRPDHLEGWSALTAHLRSYRWAFYKQKLWNEAVQRFNFPQWKLLYGCEFKQYLKTLVISHVCTFIDLGKSFSLDISLTQNWKYLLTLGPDPISSETEGKTPINLNGIEVIHTETLDRFFSLCRTQ